jgi:basic membrane protein A
MSRERRAVSKTTAVVILIAILIVAVFAVYLATRPPAAPAAKIGLILATGGLGDKSFNDISYAGALKAKQDLGVQLDYVEPKAIAEYEGFQRDFAKTGQYSIIVCIGFDQADALYTVASEYPNQKFAIVDMSVNNTNVASLLFRSNEASFLVGVVAAMRTHTGKVGFVGGMDIPLIRDFFKGYEAGVAWANSTVTMVDPVFVGGWADPTKGKELALGLADMGVDAIYTAAGKSGLGALEAVHERGITGLGVDACQCYLYPEIVASATKRVDVAVYETIKSALDNTFAGGVHSGGLKEKWVGCCRLPDEQAFWEAKFNFTHPTLSTTILNKISEANDKIVSGEIVVPTAF